METSTNQRQIMMELITTEQNYVKDIQDICEVYLPCFAILNGITSEDVATVFSNIETLRTLNKAMLDDLTAADYKLAAIAKCFLVRTTDFQLYSSYCTRYHRANERLFELKQGNPVLATILHDLQRSLGHPLPLSSYLHKPVQRILKYHLILKNLLASVDERYEARPLLVDACKSMANCAEEINNCKRLTEMDVNTRELHELLLAIRETDHFGKLLREGEMEVTGSNNTSKTMFIYMFENVLVLCHRLNGSFALHTILRCPDLVVIEDCSSRELEFMVVPFSSPSQALTLKAQTLALKLDWCIQLDKLTDHDIPSKAKKLLLANNDYIKQQGLSTVTGSKSMKRRPSLPQLPSPSTLGQRVRRRFASTVADVLTKSKSTINLRRSSSTTSGGSSTLQKNYDSAFESMSLKSDMSCSSDRLSSISSQICTTNHSPQRTIAQEHSYDDSSPHASKLHSDMDKGKIDHWHHQLSLRIHQFQSTNEPASKRYATYQAKSRSCDELTTAGDTTHTYPLSISKQRCYTAISEVEASPPELSTSRRSLFFKKVIPWKHGAGHRLQKTSLIEETTPTHSQELPPTATKEESFDNQNFKKSSYSSPSLLESFDEEVKDSNDNEVFRGLDQDCAFNLDISRNFSNSLIECFNSVLQTTNAT